MLDLEAMRATDGDKFDIVSLQLYNPIYKELFGQDVNPTTTLDHRYEVVDADHVRETTTTTDAMELRKIHFKFSPLLDPFAYMIGKYSSELSTTTVLPSPYNTDDDHVLPKIAHPCNAAYVDGFFNYLSNLLLEKHGFLHGISFYGSYLGIQRNFKVDVSDDMDHLRNSRFFTEHVGKLFTVPGFQQDDSLNVIGGSRRNKRKIDVIEDALLDNVETLEEDGGDTVLSDLEEEEGLCSVYAKEQEHNVSERSHGSSDSDLNYSSSDDEEDEEEEDEEEDLESNSNNNPQQEEDESTDSTENSNNVEENDDEDSVVEETLGTIHNFPCQMICMEKCDGTLDELFDSGNMDAEQGAAALMQVILTLLAYQKAFGFTHNDLHTNNIMYVHTDLDYLTYRFEGRVYKVPTFGRIYKIIDFGRGIYTFQQHVFCSDSFFAKGDAATQYNFGPCLDPKKPVLEPNPSFDLCRLGVSIFDFVMDMDLDVGDLDAFQKTIRRWCQDDRKHNVLYKRNGDDRYPNFKLYKMIARTVHRHTPQAQLNYAIFKQYVVDEEVDEEVLLMDLDALPSYQ